MKTITKVFALLMIAISFFPSLLVAQEGNYKHPSMRIDEKGKISKNGVTVGFITKDSLIKDAKGNKVAFVDGQGNLVDNNGKTIGRMGKDGKTYHNVNGDVVYNVIDNGKTCEIFDASGKKIGNVHSSYKGVACALHCFQMGNYLNKHADMSGSTASTGGTFACPMHPEVTGKEGDKCPKCGMKLEKVASNASYSCPMHHDMVGKEGDKCSKCSMKMTKN